MNEHIFQSNSHLLNSISLFVFCLTMFHLYWWFERPDTRFWKKIDYWWLGFSALSFITAAAGARQLVASNELARSNGPVQFQSQNLRTFAESARRYACDTPWQPPPYIDPAGQHRFDTRNEACSWFTDLSQKFSRAGDSLAAEISVLDRTLPPSIPSSWDYQPLTLAVTYAKEVLQWRRQLETDAARSDFEEGFVFLAPYLLAIALALRITKVTGELWPGEPAATSPGSNTIKNVAALGSAAVTSEARATSTWLAATGQVRRVVVYAAISFACSYMIGRAVGRKNVDNFDHT